MVFRHFLRSGWRWEGQEMRGSERSCDKSQEGPMPEPEEPSRRSNEAVASKMAAVEPPGRRRKLKSSRTTQQVGGELPFVFNARLWREKKAGPGIM